MKRILKPSGCPVSMRPACTRRYVLLCNHYDNCFANVVSITDVHFSDTSYHFASSAILMLRCAIEAPTVEVANECVTNFQQLILCLRKAKSDSEWDIADVCLNQCEPTVRRFQKPNWLGQLRQRHSRARNNSLSPPPNSARALPLGNTAAPSPESASIPHGSGPAQFEPLYGETHLDPNLWHFDLDYFENQSSTVLFDTSDTFGEALFSIE